MNRAYYNSDHGTVEIVSDGKSIVFVGFTDTPGSSCPDILTDTAFAQLCEYFEGKRRSFDLPIRADGTPFRRKVWAELEKIPYGELWTYKRLAEEIGDPKACRAVGAACGKNPIAVIIPCHRVVGADGSLTGYAYGTEIKRLLIELEHTK